jgi:hypothetical protein
MQVSGQLSTGGKPGRAPKPHRHKVNIATPAYLGQYSAAYVRSFYLLLTSAPRTDVVFSFSAIDYSDIVVARNYLISSFYFNRTDCSHILFVDNDMGFGPELIRDMLALEEDVVGVIYPKRSLNLQALHAAKDLSFATAYAKACSFIGQPGAPHPRNQAFREVTGCGAGVLLISRRCIDKLLELQPQLVDRKRFPLKELSEKVEAFLTPFNKITLPDKELSEDLSFCHRWVNDCGGKIYASVDHRIEHVGQLVVDVKYSDLGA